MIYLDETVARRVGTLIERYGLHDADAILPVPIKQVAKEEGWRVEYHSRMGKAIAMAFLVGGVKLMYVNANLAWATQRVGIAHEMGHEMAGHAVGLDTFMGAGRRHEGLRNVAVQQEKEANLIAGLLLIPAEFRDGHLLDSEVATRCTVTNGLVQLTREAVAPVRLLEAVS
jgi:Zn-dependent peptidase ImmA (M78 family)